jgi:hypothetical protein
MDKRIEAHANEITSAISNLIVTGHGEVALRKAIGLALQLVVHPAVLEGTVRNDAITDALFKVEDCRSITVKSVLKNCDYGAMLGGAVGCTTSITVRDVIPELEKLGYEVKRK